MARDTGSGRYIPEKLMRRRLILAAAAFAVAIVLPVRAQDARAIEAQAAARTWLALADNGEGLASYEAAGDRFRETIPGERWVEGLGEARKTFGPVLQRAVVSTQLTRTLQGLPDGDYATLVFRTSFAKKDIAQEVVTLEFTRNAWYVVGYIIK
jgi:hypothetical protein